jgi:hypothetical protein
MKSPNAYKNLGFTSSTDVTNVSPATLSIDSLSNALHSLWKCDMGLKSSNGIRDLLATFPCLPIKFYLIKAGLSIIQSRLSISPKNIEDYRDISQYSPEMPVLNRTISD